MDKENPANGTKLSFNGPGLGQDESKAPGSDSLINDRPVEPLGAGSSGQGLKSSTVYLRMESVGKTEARILMWTVWIFTTLLVVTSIVLLVKKTMIDDTPDNFADSDYYLAGTIVTGCCLVVSLILAYRFSARLIQVALKAQKHWDVRRKLFAVDAGVTLFCVFMCNVSSFIAKLLMLTAPRCELSRDTILGIAAMGIISYTFLTLLLLWITVMISSLQLRKDVLPETVTDPDYMLCVDMPVKLQVYKNIPKFMFWLALEIAVVTCYCALALPKIQGPETDPTCTETGASCTTTEEKILRGTIQAIVIVAAMSVYTWQLVRAIKDHTLLPYSHYRLTSMYLRISQRHTSVLLGGLLITTVVGDLIATAPCLGGIHIGVGTAVASVMITLFACASVILNMPTATNTIPAQAIKQEFTWTEAMTQQAIKGRNERLMQKVDPMSTQEQVIDAVMGGGLTSPIYNALLGGKTLRKQLASKPMFCMETAVRLYYWARFAYQHQVKGSLLNDEDAKSLYNLEEIDYIYEPKTDIKVVFGWNKSTLVIAFRGTMSMKNVKTDLKAWGVKYTSTKGDSSATGMRVHVGFRDAWYTENFNKKVLERVSKIISSTATEQHDMKLYMTGHSLGGALAILASLEIKEQHPELDSITCYTYGAPRVGNRSFVRYYTEYVPNTFAIVNKEDPIPRIPKIGYKRSGETVLLHVVTGDMVVNPTFFEVSMFSGAGKVQEHKTGLYAMSLAKFIKSQFFVSKRLPNGEEGAVALIHSVDLRLALVADNVDEESLRNLAVSPVMRVPVTADTNVASDIVEEADNILQEE